MSLDISGWLSHHVMSIYILSILGPLALGIRLAASVAVRKILNCRRHELSEKVEDVY